MKRSLWSYGIVGLVFSLLVGSYSGANASITALAGLAIGQDNQFQDDDWETIHPSYSNGDLSLDVGEVLVGMFEVDSRQSPTAFDFIGNGATFSGVFLIEVTGKTLTTGAAPSAFLADFSFGPAPAAAWTDVLVGLSAPAPGTMLRIFDDSTMDGTAGNNHDDFIDPTAATLAAALATTAGPEVAEFGVNALGGSWTARTTDAGGFADNLLLFDSGTFTADLFVTKQSMPSLQWMEVLGVTGSQHLAAVDGVLYNPLIDTAERLKNVTVFEISSSTKFWVHPIPEPASMFVWAALLGCAGVGLCRRRRKSPR